MKHLMLVLALFAPALMPGRALGQGGSDNTVVPDDVKAVFEKPLYENAVWGLRVVDPASGEVLIDLEPDREFFIGSVRKIFSVGELLNEVGASHQYNTPVYSRGRVSRAGVLRGALVLLASGDLTMGGRTNPDGTIAVSDFDHNEANSLGNAILTKPDPLAGYRALARQVAQSGITEIIGDVVIDDRMFQPFNFRDEFNVRPIFVNDDVVDVAIRPTAVGERAHLAVRPISSALGIDNRLLMGNPKSDNTLRLAPLLPQCIGEPDCSAKVSGELPIDLVPPLTNKFPLIRTFRIVEPSNYARTVFVEALESEGVRVDAAPTAQNPVHLLPRMKSYPPKAKVAELTGLPYSDDAKLILKVSYNIGADTSLLLFGLAHGVDNMNDALDVEKQILTSRYAIPADEFHFVDGSGGGDTTATNRAATQMLTALNESLEFSAFFDALPLLGVDGSLASVTDFQSDDTLAGATGQVRAKTGTFLVGAEAGLLLKGQAFGGYITAKSGRRLVYELVVNNVALDDLNAVIQVFQDEGTISAILWRDN